MRAKRAGYWGSVWGFVKGAPAVDIAVRPNTKSGLCSRWPRVYRRKRPDRPVKETRLLVLRRRLGLLGLGGSARSVMRWKVDFWKAFRVSKELCQGFIASSLIASSLLQGLRAECRLADEPVVEIWQFGRSSKVGPTAVISCKREASENSSRVMAW